MFFKIFNQFKKLFLFLLQYFVNFCADFCAQTNQKQKSLFTLYFDVLIVLRPVGVEIVGLFTNFDF